MRDHTILPRWLMFNSIGVLGFIVQLSVLAWLVHRCDVHYLVATALAVEAAVLHNFLWHQMWTWRDRAAKASGDTLRRLGRFHVLNGAVSLVGNVTLVAVLTGGSGLDPVPANLVAVAACSFVNFAACEAIVFRVAALAFVLLAAPVLQLDAASSDPAAVELRPHTVAAWQEYDRQVNERFGRLSASTAPFFVLDEARQNGWRQSVVRGEVMMTQLGAPVVGTTPPSVPDGKIHHWVGAIFVPGATVKAVLDHLQTHAGRESESYDDVLASRLLSRNGDSLRVFMKLRRDSIITVMYNTEHAVEYKRLGTVRAASRSVATKIAELAEPGTAREREKTADQDRGFLWRLNAYWRYEQTSDGVLIECESISLSRGVPTLLRPFVTGTVERIARESLERTLVSLRKVLSR